MMMAGLLKQRTDPIRHIMNIRLWCEKVQPAGAAQQLIRNRKSDDAAADDCDGTIRRR